MLCSQLFLCVSGGHLYRNCKGDRGPLCPSSHSQRSRWFSHRGIHGHCELAQSVQHSPAPAFVSSSHSQGVTPSHRLPEMLPLGSFCRIKGLEASSRPMLLVLELRAKAQPCRPFTNLQCQQEAWKFWRAEKRLLESIALAVLLRIMAVPAD